MKGWTQEHIDKLTIRKTIDDASKPVDIKIVKNTTSDEPKAVRHIISVLNEYKMEFVSEYRFTELRRFRFDFLISDLKIAIEYEGVMSEKSRHTTLKGYTRDAEKYNLASAKGYKVLRYTVLNYQGFELDLLRAIYWSINN